MKTKLLMFAALLLVGVSCKKDDLPDTFTGTTWKGKVDMKTALLPDGFTDSQYYYTLKFLTKKSYIIVMEDSNGTVVKNVWEGDYEVMEGNDKIRFVHKDGAFNFLYFPKKNEIYGDYFGITFIKQLK